MPQKKSKPPIQQTAIGNDNIQIVGSNNIITRITNLFAGEKETTEQRNRRIMLGHVENFWVKGVLEKSLYGAALLDLGIKEDPDALNYPWAIKREANKETLPADKSMLEIFQEIGIGRSLLILGAPGSGKTTMLLELTRQLIERARCDVTEPIPIVFNLSSWTEKYTLEDWLARELNNIYYVPQKTTPTWVKDNKMLLLLDGLDEVKQESRDKCVDAINQFRKENGLTSMAVCSRIQDYIELKARLAFDGAIEIQPLSSKRIDEYFNRFGDSLAGIRKVLEKDTILREMAETPLFLSIMTFAYRDTKSVDILVSKKNEIQRKHLFNTYVARMFERRNSSKNGKLEKRDVLNWLSWLAKKMVKNNQSQFSLESMPPKWLVPNKDWFYGWFFLFIIWLIIGLIGGIIVGLIGGRVSGSVFGLSAGLIYSVTITLKYWVSAKETKSLNREKTKEDNETLERRNLLRRNGSLLIFVFSPLWMLLVFVFFSYFLYFDTWVLFFSVFATPIFALFCGITSGMLLAFRELISEWNNNFIVFIRSILLRFLLRSSNYLPFRLIFFLDYCTDLIFLRRVGDGYIFMHRLLMEHFADMYPISMLSEKNTANQTITQKFFDIFRSNAETINQTNRRIALEHVEKFWVKDILEKSLYSSTLLDLEIKEDPDVLTYPWAIKREENKKVLPLGISMLEIFQDIGSGRSLLILGAPGSGKTTMLLELTRQSIERTRENVIEPIPVVFNLSSWTEKLTFTDWLTRELNVVYTIPKKGALTWLKENKIILLLDGLDEVRQESRNKCVDAINQFRQQNRLISVVVCSRIQEYIELETRLSFNGAIEIQPLTSSQVDEYFERFGKSLAGIRQVLEKDTLLHEMAKTPLFLSIMMLAYRDTKSKDILVAENLEIQRKHLFDTYIECMFERSKCLKNEHFRKQDVVHWLSWLASKMIEHNQVSYAFEDMRSRWLSQADQRRYRLIGRLIVGPIFGLMIEIPTGSVIGFLGWPSIGLVGGLIGGLLVSFIVWMAFDDTSNRNTIDKYDRNKGFTLGHLFMILFGTLIAPMQASVVAMVVWMIVRLVAGENVGVNAGLYTVPIFAPIFMTIFCLNSGIFNLARVCIIRILLTRSKLIPWHLVAFLKLCDDLIFLQRVEGGYIFVHRLLMEYFAAMYTEDEK